MFVIGGAGTFKEPEPRAALVEKAGMVSGAGEAKRAAVANGTIMMVAGSMLALGLLPKVSALALIGVLVPTTLVGHQYWKEESPAGRAGQQTQFMKNLAMLGGLLLVLTENQEA
jgi:uncharacterized membrane protein YphA (DoxX/SURF4 family)